MSNVSRSFVFIAIVALLSVGLSSTAFAQDDDAEGDAAGSLLFTTTTTGPTTTVGGGIALTVMLLTDDDGGEEVEAYLRRNSVAVQHDLHVGDGETTRDLASLFAVPEDDYQDFSELLYDNREALASLTEPGSINGDTAREFSRIIVSEMLDHETLAQHVPGHLG